MSARYQILALTPDQILAIQRLAASLGLRVKATPRARARVDISEHHRLNGDSRSKIVGNAMMLS